LLIIVYESARRWLANKKDWRALVWIAACGVGAGLALGLPRALIPVTATQQILDPFLDPNFMNTLLTMPFDLRRDFNFIFNLIAYWMPLIILATPARLKKAWSDLGTYRAWILIYLAVNLVGMMYGGTDMMRYATYFFLPQALILIHVLKQEVHVFEALYVLGALAVFNRIFFLFPIWDFGLYLDFYGGYGDHINASSYLRFLELFGLIGLGIVLRTLIHERPRPASYYLNGPEIG
jgi:hypothetical protein